MKVFVVNEFHLYYKESGIEGVCHKGVSKLLQRAMTGRFLPHLLQGVMELKFCYKGVSQYYKEMRMQDVCHKSISHKETMEGVYCMGDSHLLQDEAQTMCLSYKGFSSVTMREEW